MADPRGLNDDLNIIAKSNLEITPLNGSFNIIQQLDDEPNDVGGLSAAELKAKFDQAGLAIQTYINETLIPEVLGAASTEAQRETNEETRQAQETQRQANETARQTQEAARETGAAALSQELTVHAQTLEAELRETEAELEAQIEAREQALEVWEAYDAEKAYVPGNKVSFQGSSYVNKSGCTGVAPTGPTAAEQEAGAEHWLMIAAKGRDGTGDLTTDAADGRYIRQAGGDMAGPLTVLDPTEETHAAPKRYVDAATEAAETAAKDYADELKADVDVGTYSREQILTGETAARYGKGQDAVPDDMWVGLVPVGGILWLASQTLPDGFLLCDGSNIGRNDYAKLFEVIGTQFGAGDGSTTFTIPDLRAAFVRGAGTSGLYSGQFGVKQGATNLRDLYSVNYPKWFQMMAAPGIDSYDYMEFSSVISGQEWRACTINNYGTNGTTTRRYTFRPYNIALTPIIKY